MSCAFHLFKTEYNEEYGPGSRTVLTFEEHRMCLGRILKHVKKLVNKTKYKITGVYYMWNQNSAMRETISIS